MPPENTEVALAMPPENALSVSPLFSVMLVLVAPETMVAVMASAFLDGSGFFLISPNDALDAAWTATAHSGNRWNAMRRACSSVSQPPRGGRAGGRRHQNYQSRSRIG